MVLIVRILVRASQFCLISDLDQNGLHLPGTISAASSDTLRAGSRHLDVGDRLNRRKPLTFTTEIRGSFAPCLHPYRIAPGW